MPWFGGENKNYQHNGLTAQPPLRFSWVLTVQVGMNGRVHTWTPTPTPVLVFNDQIVCRSQEVLLQALTGYMGHIRPASGIQGSTSLKEPNSQCRRHLGAREMAQSVRYRDLSLIPRTNVKN